MKALQLFRFFKQIEVFTGNNMVNLPFSKIIPMHSRLETRLEMFAQLIRCAADKLQASSGFLYHIRSQHSMNTCSASIKDAKQWIKKSSLAFIGCSNLTDSLFIMLAICAFSSGNLFGIYLFICASYCGALGNILCFPSACYLTALLWICLNPLTLLFGIICFVESIMFTTLDFRFLRIAFNPESVIIVQALPTTCIPSVRTAFSNGEHFERLQDAACSASFARNHLNIYEYSEGNRRALLK